MELTKLLKGIKLIPKYLKKSTIFLDRDSVINDFGYVRKLNNFKFKKVIKAHKIQQFEITIYCGANQAGIVKNFGEETNYKKK